MLKTRFKQQRNVLSSSPPSDLIPSHLKVLPPSNMEISSFFKNTKKVTHGGMTLGVFYSWNISNKFKLQGLRFGLTDFVMKHYWQILFLASLLEIKKKKASEMHVAPWLTVHIFNGCSSGLVVVCQWSTWGLVVPQAATNCHGDWLKCF